MQPSGYGPITEPPETRLNAAATVQAIALLQQTCNQLVSQVKNLNDHMALVCSELTIDQPQNFQEVFDYIDFKAQNPELGLQDFKNVRDVKNIIAEALDPDRVPF
jgi:hypothetical protein